MVEQAKKTLLHEIGHYLGIDEGRLRELGVG
jgi:predicted Zn-dependent protease with MMP-like domain